MGSYQDYAEAQRVVDYLSDRGFPVQHLAIVGTDLRSVERITGRLTRGRVATAGALSGLWTGLFVGIVFALFSPPGAVRFLLVMPLLGAVFGLMWSQLGFRAATHRGARDVNSVGQVKATRYEVVVEQHSAGRAHQLLEDISLEFSFRAWSWSGRLAGQLA